MKRENKYENKEDNDEKKFMIVHTLNFYCDIS